MRGKRIWLWYGIRNYPTEEAKKIAAQLRAADPGIEVRVRFYAKDHLGQSYSRIYISSRRWLKNEAVLE